MKRIDDRTVDLTTNEVALSRTFEYFLDEGYDIPTAVERTKDRVLGGPESIDPAFWEYLAT
jgi:hypothetical protein